MPRKKTEEAAVEEVKQTAEKTEKVEKAPAVAKMSIYEKMAAITDEIGFVAKNMDVQGKYKAVSEVDVLEAVKKMEKKYRVFSYPYDRRLVDMVQLVGKVCMRIETTMRFINLDNEASYVDIKAYGDGVDTLDKAPGKAMTYADKYALMKAYKISTGDDPDKEASPDVMPKLAPKVQIQAVSAQPGPKATPEQIKFIKENVSEERMQRMLSAYGKTKLEDLEELSATAVIRRLKAEKARQEAQIDPPAPPAPKVEEKAEEKKEESHAPQEAEQLSFFDE